jgi:hypothetical protein
MERKEHKVCFHCLHNHAKDMKYICDIKGEIKIPWESVCKEFKCFSCGKANELDKCECYDDIKVKYNLD